MFKKGDKKPERSGRKPNTPNKRRSIEDVCRDMGVDPFSIMAEMAASTTPEERVLKFNAAKELAQYLESKKKDVTVAIDPEANEIKVIIERYGKK